MPQLIRIQQSKHILVPGKESQRHFTRYFAAYLVLETYLGIVKSAVNMVNVYWWYLQFYITDQFNPISITMVTDISLPILPLS